MALADLSQLDQCKATPFTTGYPVNVQTFYSPVDGVHDALKALLSAATTSVVVGMYGYDDPELNGVLQDKLTAEHIYVQVLR